MGERSRQVSAEEGALLTAKGLAALHALLQVVTGRVLDFIAPVRTSGEVPPIQLPPSLSRVSQSAVKAQCGRVHSAVRCRPPVCDW